jgi:hypothetical protein
MVDGDVAAGRHGARQFGHDGGGLGGIRHVGQREQQQHAYRLAEVQRGPRLPHDAARVAHVRVDDTRGAAGRGCHQRPGMGHDHRVAVGVRDAAFRRQRLRDFVRVA